MGFNKVDGLRCRNPAYKTLDVKENVYRFHKGDGCPGAVGDDGKRVDNWEDIVCSVNSECKKADGEGIGDGIATVLGSAMPGYGGRCNLPSCGNDPSICLRQSIINSLFGIGGNAARTFGLA